MARILFINRFYHPDEPATAQLLGDLAQGLTAAGHDVWVITSRTAGAACEERHQGVTIQRVGPETRASHSLVSRAWSFFVFWCACGWRLVRIATPGDTLVPLTDPPLIGVIAALVGSLRRVRIIHWVQDIYPEVAQQLAPNAAVRALLGLARPFRNWAWRQAESCVTLGSDMAHQIARGGVSPSRISIVPNWPPAGVHERDGHAIRQERGLAGKFVVAYSGNLGRVHHLEAIPPVAERLKDHAGIVFTFTGGGARRAALESSLTARGAKARFFPAEPRARLAESLGMGDLHWVTLKPGAEDVVFPSKFAGVLAAGRPVIFVGNPDCELARIIRHEQVGYTFAPEASDEIAACILRLAQAPAEVEAAGRRASSLARRYATLEQAILTWRRLLESPTPGLLASPSDAILSPSHVRT
ncbi:MAG TPA: glycosyltransferase family 4 protein [Opitutaceae bacterium]